MKKILALVLAALMLVAMAVPAFADDLAPAETTAPTGGRTKDAAISVSGLETGDKVSFYQVLKFSEDATTTGGWVNANAKYTLSEAQIQKMLSLDANGKPATITDAGISAALAASIADMAESDTAKYADVTAAAPAAGSEANGYTATVDNPEAGLYVAIITPGSAKTIYNPVFVAADYNDNTTNTWKVDLNQSYSPASLAKKDTITLDKTASTTEASYEDGQPETVAAGDTVSFTVVTKIPSYGANYTNPVFKVVDTLSTGLALQTGTIKVYVDTKTADDSKKVDASATTYQLNPAATTSGYTVDFASAYILGAGAGKDVVITYDAKVTTDAPKSVNLEKNTVEVKFSNGPTDETGAGRLKDETKHYTFDIDANILGETTGQWPTTEVVKVGLDANGNEITETHTTLHQGQTKVGALEGAEFQLYTANSCAAGTEYTNSILTAGKKIVSDSTGRLTIQGESTPGIRGLDVGTYYLKETKAPDGYIKAQDAVKIEIIAPKPTAPATSNDYWEEKTYTDETDSTITWKVLELKKYDVKINDVQTASYIFTNNGGTYNDENAIASKGDTVTGADSAGFIGKDDAATDASRAGKITNTQGVELPSTGGMGTTILYVAGSILVLAAGILLVTKRRMNAED